MSHFSVLEEIVYFFNFLFDIFRNSIYLIYVPQLKQEDLVHDYLFTSQKESHSFPDTYFLLYFFLFFPSWSYKG